MGNHHSTKSGHSSSNGSSTNSVGTSRESQQDEEGAYPQLGSVTINISWLTAASSSRTPPTDQISYVHVNGRGALFHGSPTPSPEILSALSSVQLFPQTIPLLDSRTHHFLVTYSNAGGGWHAISSPEFFSRHSGTCIIIGDRSNPGKPFPLKIGDCFRLGSVGVVVSEIKTDRGHEQKLDTNRLQYLREESLAFDGGADDEAALAAEEENLEKRKDENTKTEHAETPIAAGAGAAAAAAVGSSSTFFCYMCYETHDTPDDHLVAPCDCKGDTRYLHVQCLQKWYQSSVCGAKALVIRTTGNGAPACKICGAAYKTAFRSNGVKTNLLEVPPSSSTSCLPLTLPFPSFLQVDHPGPYISLVVVTRHDTSPGLFNTKFRLNFGPGYRVGGLPNELQDDPALTPAELTIGRSSLCNMVLDYRTVSTVHAKLFYRHGQFFVQVLPPPPLPTSSPSTSHLCVQDSRSSNGTMVYLQGPLPLPNNEQIRLRMGRSTLSIVAKRTLAASVRGTLHRLPTSIPCTASLRRLQEIMALAPVSLPKSARHASTTGKSGENADPSGSGEEKDQKLRSSEVDSPSPVAVGVTRGEAQTGAGGGEGGTVAPVANPSSPVNEIDHALILGLDGSREVSQPNLFPLKSDSPPSPPGCC
jgi:hypothetical protein